VAAAAWSVAASARDPATDAQDAPAKAMPVYVNALADGWQDWSWAKTRLSVGPEGSARRPIAVEAGGYQALYLHHAAFDPSAYAMVALLVQGTAPAGEVRLFLVSDGKPVGEGKSIRIGNTGWTKVEVPVQALAPPGTSIDGLWIQNPAGGELPKFYVADIAFL
jgi:hypothetical protein